MITRLYLQTTWWQQVLILGIAVSLYSYAAGWLGANWIPPLRGWGPGIAAISGDSPTLPPALFARWDAGYYLLIAKGGYRCDGPERAFFPFYPLVVRGLNVTLGIPVLWSGTLVSLLSFLGAGLILYQWMRVDYDHPQALWAVLLFFSFPVAFFFLAFYPESLFNGLGVLSLYLMRRGRFVSSGVAIALAGATRPQAFLLGIPYILEFWQQRHFGRADWLRFLAGGLIAPMGTGAFLFLLGQQCSTDPIQSYLEVQGEEWKTYFALPWETLGDALKAAIWGTHINPDWFSRVYSIHDLLYALSGLGLLLLSARRLRMSAAVYLLVSLLLIYASHGPFGYAFDSSPRHLAVVSPIFMAGALTLTRVPAKYQWIFPGASLVLLGVLSAWFASGRWVS